MGEQIRIGIFGYGNLARGVESAVCASADMALHAVYTRRNPQTVAVKTKGIPVLHEKQLLEGKEPIDVLVLCGGSAKDLPAQTPRCAALYHVVDSFDTHAEIPAHFARTDEAAGGSAHTALISCGWDPGLFSLNRLYASAILPDGADYTFWGRGVSQGHSDAIRGIRGVRDARQYTVPVEEAVEAVRSGKSPQLSARQKHTRECFVVPEEGFESEAEKERISEEIRTMPHYFADYDTGVTFITQEELEREHAELPHGGMVIRTGRTGFEKEHTHVVEYRLQLASNPEFTGAVLCAYARAVYRLSREKRFGACTVLDVPPAYLSPLDAEALRKTLL